MLELLLSKKPSETLNILCLGAHCDDIEIGCGGTLLALLQRHPKTKIHWQVFTSTPQRKKEAIAGASHFLASARQVEVEILDFRDGFLPYEGAPVKDAIEATKSKISPDIIFTHNRDDRHQDHRAISDLTWNTFRNHLILEYEIPKWDGDLGVPNFFVSIDQAIAAEKIAALQAVYNSQKDKVWFTDDLFYSLMRLRGMECNSSSTLAEAFYTRKLVLAAA